MAALAMVETTMPVSGMVVPGIEPSFRMWVKRSARYWEVESLALTPNQVTTTPPTPSGAEEMLLTSVPLFAYQRAAAEKSFSKEPSARMCWT
jgi:hypothetical protein